MKRFKVTVTKLGKRISWKGLTLSTPCKFIIEEKDKTPVKVILKRTGVSENEYKMVEVKNQSAGIDKANESVKKQAAKSAEKVTKAVKDKKSEPKKEEPKPEPKKEEPKKVESKDQKHNHKSGKKSK